MQKPDSQMLGVFLLYVGSQLATKTCNSLPEALSKSVEPSSFEGVQKFFMHHGFDGDLVSQESLSCMSCFLQQTQAQRATNIKDINEFLGDDDESQFEEK